VQRHGASKRCAFALLLILFGEIAMLLLTVLLGMLGSALHLVARADSWLDALYWRADLAIFAPLFHLPQGQNGDP